jgi:hypothetical protein
MKVLVTAIVAALGVSAMAQPAQPQPAQPPAPAAATAQAAAPMRIYIRAGLKSHGPGQHDYPQYLADWSKVLTEHGAVVDGSFHSPTAAELANIDVIVMYKGDAGYMTEVNNVNFEHSQAVVGAKPAKAGTYDALRRFVRRAREALLAVQTGDRDGTRFASDPLLQRGLARYHHHERQLRFRNLHRAGEPNDLPAGTAPAQLPGHHRQLRPGRRRGCRGRVAGHLGHLRLPLLPAAVTRG